MLGGCFLQCVPLISIPLQERLAFEFTVFGNAGILLPISWGWHPGLSIPVAGRGGGGEGSSLSSMTFQVGMVSEGVLGLQGSEGRSGFRV